MPKWLNRIYAPGGEQKNYIDDFRDYLLDGNKTSSGVHVSPENAMQITAVYSCVKVISESIAQLPVSVMRRKGKDRFRDDEHALFDLFGYRPNSWQTPFEYIENAIAHCLLRGNHVAIKVKSSDGRILELLPVNPDMVQAEQLRNYEILYKIGNEKIGYRTFKQDDIFHLRGMGSNGFWGQSAITLHREAMGLAKATERHGSTLFGNGARPGGILKHPGKISDDAERRLKKSWGDALTGFSAHKTAILEEGMEWVQLGMTSEDSQFLETRKFQRGEIASIFRVPPHKIGDLENATFSNIEHQSLEFVQDTILPWVRRFEQAVHRDLMPQRQRRTHYVKLNVDSILRGDIKTRFDAYAQAIQWGFLNPNEVRELEDRNARDNGDEFLSPLNMIPASQIGKQTEADPKPEPTPEDEEAKTLRTNLLKLVSDDR